MNLYMGLDISTQSITVQVLEINDCIKIIYDHSVEYTDDTRLPQHNIEKENKIIPHLPEGEYCQPPLMFIQALEYICKQIQIQTSYNIADICAVSVSVQQHGHVYLNKYAQEAFDTIKLGETEQTLSSLLKDIFSYPHAPIWMFSASQESADEIRKYMGGSNAMMAVSGSNSPARFTGAIIRYIAMKYPKAFEQTIRIHLLSSFISGILTGEEYCPIDWGNGSGMSLMNYKTKAWDTSLCKATLQSCVFSNKEEKSLLSLLPNLCSPLKPIGTIAPYFVKKYGFHKNCIVNAGSGDNPQTKVSVKGDLFSLGSSFVIMVDMDNEDYTNIKDINVMYDGLGNPFVFGCRTNGALVWDMVRNKIGIDFEEAEYILKNNEIGEDILLWQPFVESFPQSPSFETSHAIQNKKDYARIIDATLAIMMYYSQSFMKYNASTPLYVTGGPTNSNQIIRRIASFWNRPVIKIENAGAAYGATLSAYYTKTGQDSKDNNATTPNQSNTIFPKKEDVEKAQSFTQALIKEYKKKISL